MRWFKEIIRLISIKDMEDTVFYTALVRKSDNREMEKLFVRVFSSQDGKKVLAYLQLITFYRALNANAPDAEIRFAEGQRSLVANILRLIERGRNG